ncbi:hypothetical protein R3P38DRAFT_3377735 [Favolaschia claudopus]|uniref:Uncharacterized protein n=1 Tax=Favolaschia claudopus TaxID=2862362 RepID=A0AAV9ZB51_9AGAR
MSEVAEFKWGEIAEFPPFKVAKSKSPQMCNKVSIFDPYSCSSRVVCLQFHQGCDRLVHKINLLRRIARSPHPPHYRRPLFLDSPPYKFTSMDNSNGDILRLVTSLLRAADKCGKHVGRSRLVLLGTGQRAVAEFEIFGYKKYSTTLLYIPTMEKLTVEKWPSHGVSHSGDKVASIGEWPAPPKYFKLRDSPLACPENRLVTSLMVTATSKRYRLQRTGSLSLELEEGEERRKRSRSASSWHGFQDDDWFDGEAQSDDLPPLNPAMPTSSFSYDSQFRTCTIHWHRTQFLQASNSLCPSSRRPSASRPLHTAPAKKEDVFETYPAPRLGIYVPEAKVNIWNQFK